MRHLINPLVDCVFKAILGDPAHKEVLLAFLNAITAPEPPLQDVEILNPYTPSEFIGDDLRVVDVRARDADGCEIQLEVQLQVRPWMRSRVVYEWADRYQSQLQRGEPFTKLRPLTSIWVLAQDLIPRSPAWHHVFQLWEPRLGVQLSDHLRVHTLELHKWTPPQEGLAPADDWAYFLKEASGWTELPENLRTPELEMAMSVLERFSEKAEDYHRYQARMNFLREQACLTEERQRLEEERQRLEEELTGVKDELTGVKDELTGAKDELTGVKDELTGVKDELAAKEQALMALQARLRALGVEP